MLKKMYEVEVETDGCSIIISQDNGTGQGIILTNEQVPLLIQWLCEAVKENKESTP